MIQHAECTGLPNCWECLETIAEDPGTVVIELPFATPSLNELMGWKHRAWWRYAKWKESVAFMMRGQLNDRGIFYTAKPNHRVRVIVERHCSGAGLDDMNLRGGCKPLIDAMVDENILHNDTQTWLEDHYVAVALERGEKKKTRVLISRSEVLPPAKRAPVKQKRAKLRIVRSSGAREISTDAGEVKF